MDWSIFFAVLLVCVLVLLPILVYNSLVKLRFRCEKAASDIDVQLQQRASVIPNLLELIKGYMTQENTQLQIIATINATLLQASNLQDRLVAYDKTNQMVSNVVNLANTIPELHSSQHFATLRNELTDAENKIAAARRYQNLTVSEYNSTLEQFPNNVIAAIFHLTQQKFFDLGPNRAACEEAPRIKF